MLIADKPTAQQDDTAELDRGFCPFCGEDTDQETTGMHERDSSNEVTTCLRCRAMKLGMSGKWEHGEIVPMRGEA